jgi:phosphoglycerate kinase
MEIRNKKVLLRADFNVPIKANQIKDDYRILSTFPTMDMLKNAGAKTIILSHIETKDTDKPTLKPVFDYIKTYHPEYDIHFIDNLDSIEDKIENLSEGGFLLLENIRNLEGEKNNDIETAKIFKNITDVYINDAFAVSHRNHMSVSTLPSLYDADHKSFGIQMQKEIDSLSKILNPQKPFAVILSGAKFTTKLPLIDKYLKTADKLFIGGALFNNVLKSLGYNVGKSLIDDEAEYVDMLVKTENFENKVYIPQQVVVKNINTNLVRICNINEVNEHESIQDISEESIVEFVKILENDKYKTIVWNGPLGYYENDEFKKGTLSLACDLVSYINSNQDISLFIGGGDTVAAVNSLNIDNNRVFVSTGGGAMLEFLEQDGKLPGVVSVANTI